MTYAELLRTMTRDHARELDHEVAVILWQRGRDPSSVPDAEVVDMAMARTARSAGAKR